MYYHPLNDVVLSIGVFFDILPLHICANSQLLAPASSPCFELLRVTEVLKHHHKIPHLMLDGKLGDQDSVLNSFRLLPQWQSLMPFSLLNVTQKTGSKPRRSKPGGRAVPQAKASTAKVSRKPEAGMYSSTSSRRSDILTTHSLHWARCSCFHLISLAREKEKVYRIRHTDMTSFYMPSHSAFAFICPCGSLQASMLSWMLSGLNSSTSRWT